MRVHPAPRLTRMQRTLITALCLFPEHDILGDVLLALDSDMLKDMGITSAGQRLRLMRALDDLRSPNRNPVR